MRNKMKTLFYSLLIALIFTGSLFPQKYWERRLKDYNNPDELVTMSQSLPFNEAIALLSKVSESTTGKRVVSTVVSDSPIGIEIESMPYDKALFMIVQYSGFILDEKEDIIVVKRLAQEEVKPEDIYASVDSREVKISAVFFEVDVAESKERGIDWKFLLSQNGLDLGTELISQTTSTAEQKVNPSSFGVTGAGDFNLGDFYGQATAMFRFFEQENLGEIIASPNIVVRDKNQGRIQVGSDFSVRTRDFAGNTVEKFFPTGTIIEVTPHVYNEGGLDYILLKIMVERSSFLLNEETTEIKKTNASTQVLTLNGEESILGGLFINEETVVRNGIPFLKDLPWWFFGIRYLTGADQTISRKKELVILLKTELMPSLKERLENPIKNPLNSEISKQNNRVKFYQMESTDSQFKVEE